MEFRGEDDEMADYDGVEQAVRGAIGCAAVIGLLAGGAVAALVWFGLRWAFSL